MKADLAVLRAQLDGLAGTMPVRSLDANKVRGPKWAGRHESSFQGKEFADLKELIALSGGNSVPILVRQVDDGFELIYGQRRLRACRDLNLPVAAIVWQGPMSDEQQFMAAELENRIRRSFSPFEQGAAYKSALDAGLFPSLRALAKGLGISHVWVSKVIAVATLPPEVVAAFDSPGCIQHRHAKEISDAMALERDAVLHRAGELVGADPKLQADEVVDHLVGRRPPQVCTGEVASTRRVFGSWKAVSDEALLIRLESEWAVAAVGEELASAIAKALELREARAAKEPKLRDLPDKTQQALFD